MVTTFSKAINKVRSTLALGIDASVGTLTVATGGGALFPSTFPFRVSVELERMICTNRVGDVLTVTRHAEDSIAVPHLAGVEVRGNITAGIITELQTAINLLEVCGGAPMVAASDASTAEKMYALVSGGAVCDGTADNVEIQTAIIAGGDIRLSSGLFTCVGCIWLPTVTPVTLRGAGMGQTTINWTGNELHPEWINTEVGSATDIVFQDFTIEDKTAGTGWGWALGSDWGATAHYNWLVQRVEVINCGIRLRNIKGHCQILDCYVHDVTRHVDGVIFPEGCDYVEIAGNTVDTVYAMGIAIGGTTTFGSVHDNSLTDCTQGLDSFAIDGSNTVNLDVHDNYISSHYGINSENSAGRISIHGNIVEGYSTGYGIQVWRTATGEPKAASVSIIGNTLRAQQHPIRVTDEDVVEISHNSCFTCERSIYAVKNAVWGVQPTIFKVQGNILYDCGRSAYQAALLLAVQNVWVLDNVIMGTSIADSFALRFGQAASVYQNNHISGFPNVLSDCDAATVFQGNTGYIAPGEVRTVAVPFIAGKTNKNDFLLAWQNPEAQSIVLFPNDLMAVVTTAGGTDGATLDVGSATSATTHSSNLIWQADLNAKGFNASIAGVTLDANGGTTSYITGQILGANASSLAGTVYIKYRGA